MRKIVFLVLSFFVVVSVFAQENVKNLVVLPYSQNLSAGETAWLPDSVKDKFESNIQTYMNYSLVSSSDKMIRDAQKKFGSVGYDEQSAIEFGKLVGASHSIFLTVRKAGSSYTLTAEFTNLTTGKLIAKSVSSGKTKTDDIFNVSGCSVDEVTIDLCDKLKIPLSNTQKYLLMHGNIDVSDKDALAMYNQELAGLDKQIKNFDAEITKLMKSSDLDSVTKMNKIKSERALAEQKRKTAEENKRRLDEIEKAKKEEFIANATRTAEQQKKILDVSKEVNAKVSELRKMKMENLSSLGKIRVLESKKAALIEIRNNVQKEQLNVPAQYKKEYDDKVSAIKNAPWRRAELNYDDTPTEDAKRLRNEKLEKIEVERTAMIVNAQKKIAEATYESQSDIICEIMLDQESLSQTTFYANTLNKNLRVSIGRYGANLGGWKLKYTVLSDGVEIANGDGVIKYDDIEKIMPSEMNKLDAIDMYDSLLKCGDPVLSFQIAYKVSERKDKISTYGYESDCLYAYDTKKISVGSNGAIDGKENINIGSVFYFSKKIEPGSDWLFLTTNAFSDSNVRVQKTEKVAKQRAIGKMLIDSMVQIPDKNYMVGKTEVTQKLYQFVMGDNPSYFKGDNLPVETVSWYDCIYFCNKLSEIVGYTPVYSVNGETDVEKWGYAPNNRNCIRETVIQNSNRIRGAITQDLNANGFRLPTEEEWEYAAKCGQNYEYSGSNNLNDVGWYTSNSGNKTHLVGQKKVNDYGLYDMSGNVCEWCWDSINVYYRYNRGGSYDYSGDISRRYNDYADCRDRRLGFRLFMTTNTNKS